MKTYKVKNYKGNLLESVKKFQETHKGMKIVEAFEQADLLNIAAEPVPEDPNTTEPTPPDVAAQIETADPIMDFGCKLLMFGTKVHAWHLNCERNSQHLALKDLYEACDDVADRILEAQIGRTGKPVTALTADYSDLTFTEESINEIAAIKNEGASLIGQGPGLAGLDNILGEFCETCDSVIYKLIRLV